MPKTRLYTTDYAPSRGGVARYLGNLAGYFSDSMEVTVLDPSTRWWQALRRFLKDRRLLPTLSVGSSVIVSHLLPIGTAALAFKWMTGTPYVVIAHGMDVGLARTRWLKRIVAGMVLRGAKAVVANSKALEREVRKEFGVERTVVVYPTISKHVSPPHREEGAGVVVARVVRLLTVARLVPRKGHLRVLDALEMVESFHPELSIHYTIVGDGPEYEEIVRSITAFGLADIVTIVRDATDAQLDDYYSSADLFVMPVIADSVDREGFGMVYLEAALHGIPSIATDMPGVDEAVLDRKTGILVKDGDIAALAFAVYRLATNEGERRRLGEAARTRAIEEFSAERQFEKLRQYL